jgi:hypothetical protein
MPGTSNARKSAAYLGTASGMPGSDWARNRGFDLYGQQAEERNQRGIQDLLSLISGTTAPTLQAQAQANQVDQFGRSLNQNASQFAADQALKRDKVDFAGRPDYASGGGADALAARNRSIIDEMHRKNFERGFNTRPL